MVDTLPILALILALIIALVVMGLTFGHAERIDNYSIVDVAWCINFTLITLAYATVSDAPWIQRLLMIFTICLWSLRLGWHLHHLSLIHI